jgi:hypothetical protein
LGIERQFRIIDSVIGQSKILNEQQFGIAVRRLGVPRAAVADLQAVCGNKESGYNAAILSRILHEAVETTGGDKLVQLLRGPVRAAIMGMRESKFGWSAAAKPKTETKFSDSTHSLC